jgi:hypothetical protein
MDLCFGAAVVDSLSTCFGAGAWARSFVIAYPSRIDLVAASEFRSRGRFAHLLIFLRWNG